MKQFSASLACIFFCFIAAAQNVGIGTVTPTKPLTVRQDGIGIRQEGISGANGIGFYTSGAATYLQTHNATDLLFATNDSSATMVLQRGTGNVGIGTTSPTANLHVNGTVRIKDGTEAGGRVLTSDAAGNATWKTAAYGNTERFFFEYKVTNTVAQAATALYNYGTVISSLQTSPQNNFRLTFTKAGLYHFDIGITAFVLGTFNSNLDMFTTCSVLSSEVYSVTRPFVYAGPATPASLVDYDKSFDIYIPSPGFLSFYIRSASAPPAGIPYSFVAKILGTLVSE